MSTTPDHTEIYRLVFQLNEAMCAYNRAVVQNTESSKYTRWDSDHNTRERWLDVDTVEYPRQALQRAVNALNRGVPAPAIPPVFVVGSHMPGYSPDPDNIDAMHVDIRYPDDIASVTNSFVERMTRALESVLESQQYERELYSGDDSPCSDPEDIEIALRDIDDAISGDSGMLESLQSSNHGDTVAGDVWRGIRTALVTGTEYSYTLNFGNDTSESFFLAPCEDEPVYAGGCTCDEYTEHGSYGCQYVPKLFELKRFREIERAQRYAGQWREPGSAGGSPGSVMSSWSRGVPVGRFALMNDIRTVTAEHVAESNATGNEFAHVDTALLESLYSFVACIDHEPTIIDNRTDTETGN